MNRDGTPKNGPSIPINLPDPPLTEERWLALQRVLKSRGYGKKSDAMPYPNSLAATGCGGRLGGFKDRARPRKYRCKGSKWRPGDNEKCDCSRIDADWLDCQVWSAVIEVLSDPNRLRSLAEDYLGLREAADEPETDTLDSIQAKIDRLQRARVGQVTAYLRAGVAADVVAAASTKVDEEIAALSSYRDEPAVKDPRLWSVI